jgi:stage V sporulation protein D (sporulation-specific penicillin-binding protein)
VAVTGLQLVGAYSAVANGGYLMQPQIVKAILAEDGTVVEEVRWSVVRQVVDDRVAATLKELMTCVTEYGTGQKARVAEVPVAGKTGTAQKAGDGGHYDPSKWVSSFVGMAPADDPQIVCLVVVDEPRGRGLGGEVAAPVFAKILERMVRSAGHEYLLRGRGDYVADDRPKGRAERMTAAGIQPELATDGRGRFEFAVAHGTGGATLGIDPSRSGEPDGAAEGTARGFDLVVGASECIGAEVEVPDLRGVSIRKARRMAAELGLVLSFEGGGVVREQSPRPGSSVKPGHKVVVRCSG